MSANCVIGLDIGSMSIRAAETRRSKTGPVVSNFGQVPLPLGAVKGGVVHDDKAVTTALKQLWATAGLDSRQVVLGVTNRQVVVREATVANVPAKEMRRSLPLQVREMLPLPMENSLLDFYPLEQPGDAKTVRGLLIAAPKDAVVTAIEATERAGLHVSTVDLASFALLRASGHLEDEVEAIVDIGAQATTVVVHQNGEPLIVRTVPRGGHEITEMLADRLGVDLGGSEALKQRVGLNREEEPETAEMIREVVRPLIREVRGSFSYLTAREQPKKVTHLLLSGGGAHLPGLAGVLQQDLEVVVRLANPLLRVRDTRHSVNDALTKAGASATVAVGLSLGGNR